MKQNTNTTGKRVIGKRVDPLAKKKMIFAGILVLVMAVMWIRLFAKSGKSALPAEVSAETLMQQAASGQQVKKESMSLFEYIELPVESGRNDCLKRDLFGAKAWYGKGVGSLLSMSNGDNANGDLLAEEIREVALNLKLEAVIEAHDGQNAEVFINNKLVPTGGELIVRRNGVKYIYTIESADGNKVTLSCGDVRVTLKMSDKDEKVIR